MAKKPQGRTRREFLRDATVAAGSVALAGALPAVDAVAQGAKAPEPKLGAQLIGKLEGPELILDPAKWPKKFAEAPMLGDLVKAGKLPPVEKRVPEEPMVVKPLQGIGRYGGTWRRGFDRCGPRRRRPHRRLELRPIDERRRQRSQLVRRQISRCVVAGHGP